MRVVTGFVLGLLAAALVGAAVIFSGAVSVAANRPENPVIGWVLTTAMQRSVARHAPALTLGPGSDEQVMAGYRLYSETCIYCHGGPGKDPTDIGKGLNPEPPFLADTVGRWSGGELYWIVRNGVRMTGMPAFGDSHSDEEIRAVVQFVRKLPGMTEEQFAAFEKK